MGEILPMAEVIWTARHVLSHMPASDHGTPNMGYLMPSAKDRHLALIQITLPTENV